MPETSITYPTSVSTTTVTDGVDWTNPSNITANNGSYATCTLAATESTYELKATNFGFSLDKYHVPTTISVRIKCKQGSSDELQFKGINLLYDGAIIGNVYREDTYIYGDEHIFTVGEGLWESNIDYAKVSDSSFGVSVYYEGRDGSATGTVSVEYITVNVGYSIEEEITDIRDLSVDNAIELYSIDFSPIGYSSNLFITPYTNGQGQEVVFNGITYQPIPMSTSGFGWDGKSALPTPTITLSNVLNTFSEINITYGNLLGVEVTRIQTFAQYLDTGSSPDPFATLPEDVYYIAQKVNQNDITVEYKLASIVDLEGIKLPRGKYYRDSCIHQYRRPLKDTNGNFIEFDYGKRTTCPYAGDALFDINGESVTESLEDVCSYRLQTGCIPRFKDSITGIPIKAFPGITDKPSS